MVMCVYIYSIIASELITVRSAGPQLNGGLYALGKNETILVVDTVFVNHERCRYPSSLPNIFPQGQMQCNCSVISTGLRLGHTSI